MNPENTQNIIGWVVGLVATSGIAIIIGIINIIKSGTMIKRDVRGADLSNKSKEVSLAEQYETLTNRATQKVLDMQERLDSIENQSISLQGSMDKLRKNYSDLEGEIKEQKELILQQTTIIEEQGKRLELQEIKMSEQQEEISRLRKELEKERRRNYSLMNQMKENNIIPNELEGEEKKLVTKKTNKRSK